MTPHRAALGHEAPAISFAPSLGRLTPPVSSASSLAAPYSEPLSSLPGRCLPSLQEWPDAISPHSRRKLVISSPMVLQHPRNRCVSR
jgi:hypothetical protein